MHMDMDLIFDMFANKTFIRVFYYKSIEAKKHPLAYPDDCYTCASEFDIDKFDNASQTLNRLIKIINMSVNELLTK